MNQNSRLENSLKNTIFSVLAQGLTIGFSFVVRYFFIRSLPMDYLGVNGLFTNILSVLSLAELGIGTAIVYSMYKPIAENDEEKIRVLMQLYKKIYCAIGCIVAVVGVLIIPYLDILVKDKPDISGLTLIYLIFLADTSVSYFFSYKRSLISADQREYMLSLNRLGFLGLKSVLQIVVLLVIENYYIYLVIQVICTMFENIVVSYLVDKMYPFLRTKTTQKLSKEERQTIIDNVKALFIYKVATIFLGGIDNIIISARIGVLWVAKYSNYTLVVNSLMNALNMFCASITASIGNFVVKEGRKEQKKLLDKVVFVTFLLFGFSSVCLYGLLNAFIQIYCGEEYLLSSFVVVLVIANFYIMGMMSPMWTFRTTMGLFVFGKWRPVISAIINFVLSVWWAEFWGIEGVVLATIVSRVVTNLWFDPYIIYKKGLGISPITYYAKFIGYSGTLCGVLVLLKVVTDMFSFETDLLGFVTRCVIVFLYAMLMFGIIIFINPERRYYMAIIKNLLGRFSRK